MGGSCSKEKDDLVYDDPRQIFDPPNINLFADPTQDTDLDSEDATETELEEFSLTDEFAFDELLEDVFKPYSDCIVDESMSLSYTGTICGRIHGAKEHINEFGGKYILIDFASIQSNGDFYFQTSRRIGINDYPGKTKLSQLPVRPILPEEKEKLAQRGRTFSKLGLGVHHQMYVDSLFAPGLYGAAKILALGDVIVDTASFFRFNPNYDGGGVYDTAGYDATSACNVDETQCSKTIPERNLHLCWPTLCGYSLAKKKWGEISLDHLSEMQFREDPIDLLVLEKGFKDLVRGLVQNIHNEGCSILLQGPPGVGKTSTAEAVSEMLHRPLYGIDVGDLGYTPEVLEENLKQKLELAKKWNAVVLIDECDMFLAAQNKSDILRNLMVGTFLRLVENYNGILFLTSNRADEMDQSFQRRISVALAYKDLDVESRRQIWTNLLGDTKDLDVSQLAQYDLNGRQIETAIRVATWLAGAEEPEEPLSQHHLLDTIRYTNLQPAAVVKRPLVDSNPPESPLFKRSKVSHGFS